MSHFDQWMVASKFKIEIHPENSFKLLMQDPGCLTVNILCQNELIQKDHPLFSYARSIYGVLKTKTLYPCEVNNKQMVFVIPTLSEPKDLALEKHGGSHKAAHFGSLLASVLLNNPFENQKGAGFCIILSDKIKAHLMNAQSDFLLGILGRSFLNKEVKIPPDERFKKSIFFAEDFVTAEHLFYAKNLSHSMNITRSFINMPPNILNPDSYEQYVRTIVKNECEEQESPGHILINVFEYEKLKNMGAGLICAVGQGSDSKPRIIQLVYHPSLDHTTTQVKSIALVGKGITFDSGGYDIKPSAGMRNMKKDMGGSAAVLGVFIACARLKLPVKLSCYLAVAENMVSGSAMRPGDVYKSLSGLRVEIDNTDAEGRLVLADALTLATQEEPHWIIDIATLTGAARTALGPNIDCMYGNHSELNHLLHKTSIETGDWVWNMPLVSEYENYFDSTVADFMNCSPSPFAGSITAALFLQKFVASCAWSHIDSFMWCDKPNGLWHEGGGATAKCVRLVTRAIEKYIKILA